MADRGNEEKRSSEDSENTQPQEDVDFVLSAGAEALQQSLKMFGDPLAPSAGSPTTHSEDKTEIKSPEITDDPSAAAGEIRASPSAPLQEADETGENNVTPENGNENEAEDSEDEEHVDFVIGAGAQALQDSVAMFGSPNLPSDDVTEGADDDVTNEDDDKFIPDDEKDVTRHDDTFNIDVRIRLMTKDDEPVVRKLIYDGIYVAALIRTLLNATERPFVIITIGLFAVLFSWLFGGVILAMVLSVLGLPLLFYLYLRYIALAMYRRRHLPDIQTGIHKYWSATDQGRIMWVAEVDNKVVGSVAIETHSAIACEIRHLSVNAEWQCLGIGGQLAQHALSHIKRRRFKKVITHVLSVYNEATNMCNKLGFRRTNARSIWCGFCSVEDYDMNLSTGSRALLTEE